MKQATILFFVDGPMPTAEQFAEAQKLPAQVKFRNAQQVPDSGALEAADGVAGSVPQRYADVYPEAAEAIKNVEKFNKEQLKKGGEIQPPKVGTDIPLLPERGADTTGTASGNTAPVAPNTNLKPKPTPVSNTAAVPKSAPGGAWTQNT